MILKINNKEVELDKSLTIIQACDLLDIEVPRFCYHEKLSIAGNCRICLVEVNGRILPSCVTDIANNMEIFTDSQKVREARKDVMRFMLANHPLDCPICDQGGECDLQDQAYLYGHDRAVSLINRRAVPDKDFGPLLSTAMTRCIHCTRCIRFSNEIAGYHGLVAVQTGHHMEITNPYGSIDSELSGNLADVCPVGAITSTQYRYSTRPWELKSHIGIDISDAIGANIRIDTFNDKVVRILPRVNEQVNQFWISDKARYSVDGLMVQRIDKPYIRCGSGLLSSTSWQNAIKESASILKRYKPDEIAAVVGDLCDMESIMILKKIMKGLGVDQIESRIDNSTLVPNAGMYTFNSEIQGVDRADAILIIGSNIKWEAALLSARIRGRFLKSDVKIGLIGQPYDCIFDYEHLGAGLNDIINFDKTDFAKCFKAAKYPMLVVGNGVSIGNVNILNAIYRIFSKYENLVRPDWNGYNYLNSAASRVGALHLGFYQEDGSIESIYQGIKSKKIKAVFVLGADSLQCSRLQGADIIYQGHHGSDIAMNAAIVLPGAAYTEKSGTYMNIEGRVQQSEQACMPPGDAKVDCKILNELMDAIIGKSYCSELNISSALLDKIRNFAGYGEIAGAKFDGFPEVEGDSSNASAIDMPIGSNISNFYLTNIIAQHSTYMIKAAKEFRAKSKINATSY